MWRKYKIRSKVCRCNTRKYHRSVDLIQGNMCNTRKDHRYVDVIQGKITDM